ncbi:Hypothetical protein R9X50_00187100 [Acrodontium crateriforme]|uniref:Methyltransferase domain-containing protein n=1 Tax=Acrodontium crateriforme TaxID=150365 RepID=A0AAQ3LZR8_9PEZI|nr:Hypothetical protein R9X50_00187100 [Acrodontium crateriforme]
MTANPQAPGHNDYVPGYAHIKHHEWRTAENSAGYLIPVVQSKVEENAAIKLLDVGAGPGTITVSLAKYMPEGQLIATDLSDAVLEKAAVFAEQAGVKNIEFQAADIYALPFPDNTFDIVHAHQVLTHLDAPVAALKEMLRVAKPGGVIATRESDLRMWNFHPQVPGVVRFHETMLATHAAGGGATDAGVRLVSWAMKAGAKRESITASMGTWCYSTPGERRVWGGTMAERARNGEFRKKALQVGIATDDEFEFMAKGWDEWIATEDACLGCMHGEILVRK